MASIPALEQHLLFDLDTALRVGDSAAPVCSIPTCTRHVFRRELCHYHYRHQLASGGIPRLKYHPLRRGEQPDADLSDPTYGYCHCGCGQKTTIADVCNRTIGQTRGKPMRFCKGHESKFRYDRTFEDRFWGKVQKSPGDGCWLWAGAQLAPYGAITRSGKALKAHRVSWELANGPIPDGLFVCHHCDTPLCVRPDHLFLGTVLENNRDSLAKGRRPHGDSHPVRKNPSLKQGENNGMHKLMAADVRAIRALYRGGTPVKEIAPRYSFVSYSAVEDVAYGKTWKSVGD